MRYFVFEPVEYAKCGICQIVVPEEYEEMVTCIICGEEICPRCAEPFSEYPLMLYKCADIHSEADYTPLILNILLITERRAAITASIRDLVAKRNEEIDRLVKERKLRDAEQIAMEEELRTGEVQDVQ